MDWTEAAVKLAEEYKDLITVTEPPPPVAGRDYYSIEWPGSGSEWNGSEWSGMGGDACTNSAGIAPGVSTVFEYLVNCCNVKPIPGTPQIYNITP